MVRFGRANLATMVFWARPTWFTWFTGVFLGLYAREKMIFSGTWYKKVVSKIATANPQHAKHANNVATIAARIPAMYIDCVFVLVLAA